MYLVIGSENHSGGLERSTRGRGVTVIFGDGAGAAVLSREEDTSKGVLSIALCILRAKYAKELSLWKDQVRDVGSMPLWKTMIQTIPRTILI